MLANYTGAPARAPVGVGVLVGHQLGTPDILVGGRHYPHHVSGGGGEKCGERKEGGETIGSKRIKGFS